MYVPARHTASAGSERGRDLRPQLVPRAPWQVVHDDDKRRGRLNLITHLLSQVPYGPLARNMVTCPKRQASGKYREPDLEPFLIPTPF